HAGAWRHRYRRAIHRSYRRRDRQRGRQRYRSSREQHTHYPAASAGGAGQRQTFRRMKAFEYATALSTDSARELAGTNGAYLAGGNDLLALMKEYLVDP